MHMLLTINNSYIISFQVKQLATDQSLMRTMKVHNFIIQPNNMCSEKLHNHNVGSKYIFFHNNHMKKPHKLKFPKFHNWGL